MSQHIKTSDGYDVKVPSNGQVNLNTVLGAIGTAGVLSGGMGGGGNGSLLGGLFGGNRNCGPDAFVTRYEQSMVQELAAKDSKIAHLESTIFTDQKITETYKELRGMIAGLQEVAAQQAITNTAFNSAMQAMDYKFSQQIALEAERRLCADGMIVNYVNSTFAPRLITDYTAGTTSAPASVYNPLACGNCCNGGPQM